MAPHTVKKVKLLYDARSLKPETRHWGPGVVTAKILEHLPESCDTTGVANYFPDAKDMGIKTWPHMGVLNKALFETGPLWAGDFDVYWGTNLFLPQMLKGRPGVITVHDLLLFDKPGDQRGTKYFQQRFVSSVNRADKILTDSKASADRLLELFPRVKKKVEVALLGYETLLPSEQVLAQAQAEFPYPYVIMLGAHRPRKRLDLILECVRGFQSKRNIKLLITGDVHESYQKLLHKYEDISILSGMVDKVKLMALIKNSQAVLFPTTYEGFGFPVLEGMAMEVPVICSNIQILNEVGGEAALYPDFNIGSWSTALDDVLSNESLRKELTEKGKINLSRFSWKKTADIYMNAFLEVNLQH